MQMVPLPKSIYDELNSISHSFLWGGSDDLKKVHLLKWSKICDSKIEGGLGLRPSHLLNAAYMIKLGWRYIYHSDSLWSCVLAAQYYKGCVGDFTKSKKSNWSPIWRGILKGSDVVMSSISIFIGNDISTKFRLEEWVNNIGPLIAYVSNPSLIPDLNVTVADFFYQGIDLLKSSVPLLRSSYKFWPK